ncbi:Glycine betaine-Na(+) symporter [Tritonibacter multivorans]|uniref:Glycine betaine-Na(+) symporter n=1 Tax=Tritonibacter multivorans TaxID=928856 RepID=A0A0N7M022_9RHOB|nr:BCCT family transporter [Tritonibacter multivorans]MDA7419889.1 BCCT family transporter [Tritonibacter multivorans]CUH79257.1 Glycine betaine-Na(+) symporter [Tritonibacter multivorans]SFC13003.1 betaine/carnitine transporter, BCCT family [Tritonibacter multivorans]
MTDTTSSGGLSESTETDSNYEIGQDNIQPFGLEMHNPVFPISAVCIVLFVVLALTNQEASAALFGWLRPYLTSTFDWFLMWSVNIMVVFCFFLALSPLGKVRIGGKNATPDYSYTGWIAMLFSAGIGIGLLFFGVLEPMYYSLPELNTLPLGLDPSVPGNENMGIVGTVFHWGISGWAVYVVVGLSLAIAGYNLNLPLTLRSAFYPLFKERVWGWPGHVIDIIAVFATLFGLTTSLGLGAQQVAAGLNDVFGLEVNTTLIVVLILLITAVALVSVVLGMDAGVKRLSEINMAMAALLLLFVLIMGPTFDLLGRFGNVMVDYVVNFVPLSNPHGREDLGFMHGWTTFYWAWWIAWSPFVGMFIARISKGRTVREFILCVLIAPSLVCALWMTIFGGMAMDQMAGGYDGVKEVVAAYKPELALFRMLDQLPLYSIVAPITLVLIVIFFVTSSDSGSLVIDTITAGGKIDAPVAQRVFWCTFEGLVAIALLLGGGLNALQGAAVSMGIPFTVVVLAMCLCLYAALRSERAKM